MKQKIKYNLTIWQRLQLPLLWLYWIFIPIAERKTWHLVKKGMEKHEHRYTKFIMYQGCPFYKCSHEGCNLIDTYIK